MLENGPPCCPRPPHLPRPAPPVAAPQLPRCCRGWGQPRELLGIATQAAAPTAITESWNALSWKNPQGLLSPTPGPVQSPTIPPGMLRVGFAGGNTRRDLQRGLQLPGCKAPDLLEPPAESTDVATGWSPSSICAPRTGISALGLSYFQSHAYAPGDFFYLGLVLQPTMSSWLE